MEPKSDKPNNTSTIDVAASMNKIISLKSILNNTEPHNHRNSTNSLPTQKLFTYHIGPNEGMNIKSMTSVQQNQISVFRDSVIY